MKFEWDEEKNKQNLAKHGIDFQFAQCAFFDSQAIETFDRTDGDENRYRLIGAVQLDILLVVFVERAENKIRLITARKADKNERECYYGRRF